MAERVQPRVFRVASGFVAPAAMHAGMSPRVIRFAWFSGLPLPVGNTKLAFCHKHLNPASARIRFTRGMRKKQPQIVLQRKGRAELERLLAASQPKPALHMDRQS